MASQYSVHIDEQVKMKKQSTGNKAQPNNQYMIQASETEILFDDLAIIEAMRGAGYYPVNTSVRDNCDCTDNFYPLPKDEKADTPKSA